MGLPICPGQGLARYFLRKPWPPVFILAVLASIGSLFFLMAKPPKQT